MLTISNTAKTKLPKIPFSEIKNAILGADYELSLAFVPPMKMKQISRIHRDIDKPTDILSFPLSEKEGEMYICLIETKKEAKKFDRTFENFLGFLFIHGCVHLKGMDHGSTMERTEVQLREKFNI